jgi:hypothetical protein
MHYSELSAINPIIDFLNYVKRPLEDQGDKGDKEDKEEIILNFEF